MRKVYLIVRPEFDRCLAASEGDTTWVWIPGGHRDLMKQLAQLDAILDDEEKAIIQAAYGWDTGDEADVLSTPTDHVPPALRPPAVTAA